jgi:hypothetical protein
MKRVASPRAGLLNDGIVVCLDGSFLFDPRLAQGYIPLEDFNFEPLKSAHPSDVSDGRQGKGAFTPMALSVSAVSTQNSSAQTQQLQLEEQRQKQANQPAQSASQQIAGARHVPSPPPASGQSNPLLVQGGNSRAQTPAAQRPPASQPAAAQQSQATQKQASSQATSYPSIDIRA